MLRTFLPQDGSTEVPNTLSFYSIPYEMCIWLCTAASCQMCPAGSRGVCSVWCADSWVHGCPSAACCPSWDPSQWVPVCVSDYVASFIIILREFYSFCRIFPVDKNETFLAILQNAQPRIGFLDGITRPWHCTTCLFVYSPEKSCLDVAPGSQLGNSKTGYVYNIICLYLQGSIFI